MHIKKVAVTNFRNEGIDIIWELNPDVNILVGKNGCGKTTLLQNIEECFLNPYTKEYRLFKVTRELNLSSSSIVEFLHKQGYTDVIEDLNAKISQGEYLLLIKHFAPDKLKYISKTIQTEKFSHQISLDLSDRYDKIDIDSVSRLNTFDNQLNRYLEEYDAAKTAQYSTLDIDLQQKKLAFILFQSELRKKLDHFYFGKIKLNEAEKKEMEAELQTNHQRITAFTELVNTMFKDTEKTIDIDNFTFTLKNGSVIELSELSSGEKQVMLILLTALLQNHQETVLLLDEPEISLDTYWQRDLLKNIRIINPNCQLIVVTHSPAIIGRGWTEHFKRWEELVHESKKELDLNKFVFDVFESSELKIDVEDTSPPKILSKINLESSRRKTPPPKS